MTSGRDPVTSPQPLVGGVVAGTGAREPVARIRCLLVGLLSAAMLAASASAGGFGLSVSGAGGMLEVASHLAFSTPERKANPVINRSGTIGPLADPPTPADNQFAVQCGRPPQLQCGVEVIRVRSRALERSGREAVTLALELVPGASDGTVAVDFSTELGAVKRLVRFPFGATVETVTINVREPAKRKPKTSLAIEIHGANGAAAIESGDLHQKVKVELANRGHLAEVALSTARGSRRH